MSGRAAGRPNHHEPAAAYRVSVHELPRREGALLPLRLDLPALPDMGGDVISVPLDARIAFEGRAESVSEGVLVTGRIAAPARGECVRCLAPVEIDVEAELCELIYYPERARAAAEAGDDEDELRVLDSDQLDLEGPIRDALLPQLPFQPLCSEQCAGLCPDCGVRLDDHPGHRHDRIDPRWAALDALRESSER